MKNHNNATVYEEKKSSNNNNNNNPIARLVSGIAEEEEEKERKEIKIERNSGRATIIVRSAKMIVITRESLEMCVFARWR